MAVKAKRISRLETRQAFGSSRSIRMFEANQQCGVMRHVSGFVKSCTYRQEGHHGRHRTIFRAGPLAPSS